MYQEYKFERLEVWQLSMDYLDIAYKIADTLPVKEKFNLYSQLTRAATSISLNIAEGSTSTTNPDNRKFVKIAIKSFIETVACHRIIVRRNYLSENNELMVEFEKSGVKLFAKLQAYKNSL